MRLCSVSDGSRRAVFDSMVDHPNLLSMNHQCFFDSFKIFWPTVEKNQLSNRFSEKSWSWSRISLQVLCLDITFNSSQISSNPFLILPKLNLVSNLNRPQDPHLATKRRPTLNPKVLCRLLLGRRSSIKSRSIEIYFSCSSASTFCYRRW